MLLAFPGSFRRFPFAAEEDNDDFESSSAAGLDDEVSPFVDGETREMASGSILSYMHKALVSPTRQNLSDAFSRHVTCNHAPPPKSSLTYQEAARRGLLPVEGDDLYLKYTVTERMFLGMATKRDWTQNEAREVLDMLLDPRFRIEDLSADVLRRVSFTILFLFHSYYTVNPLLFHSYNTLYSLIHNYMQFKIDVSNGGILCENMHRPGDGDQDLHLYYFDLEGLVRDMFADPMVEGKQHLYFKADIAPSGKRRFTDAHTCLAFEEAARKIGPGVAIYSLVLFMDGTHQWKNVHVCPVYISTLDRKSTRLNSSHSSVSRMPSSA